MKAPHSSLVIVNVNRRGFLKGVLGAGAFILGIRYIPEGLLAQSNRPVGFETAVDKATLHPSVYVGIDTDGTVHIVAHRSEMGTVIRTSLPLVLADELDADWKRVEIEQARRLDPLSLAIQTDIGFEAFYSSDYERAERQLKSVLEMDPHFAVALHIAGDGDAGGGFAGRGSLQNVSRFAEVVFQCAGEICVARPGRCYFLVFGGVTFANC